MGYNVYISSVYKEFADIREKIFQTIRNRSRLYVVKGMEDYTAEDASARDVCCRDVLKSDIFVCILGYTYGSIADAHTGWSFTHYEYDTARKLKESRKSFTRLFFIKRPEDQCDSQLLTDLKKEILEKEHILCKFFDDDNKLPDLIIESLDNYIGSKKDSALLFPEELKYMCNRAEHTDVFETSLIRQLNNQLFFYLVPGHEYNGHYSFVARCLLGLRKMFNDEEPVEVSFLAFKNPPKESAILDTLKSKMRIELRKKSSASAELEELSANGLLKWLYTEKKYCLIVRIIVQTSTIQKHGDLYKNSIEKFCATFSDQPDPLYKDRKLLFFLHVAYIEEAEENELVQSFEKQALFKTLKLPELEKIGDPDVAEWMRQNKLSNNQAEIRQLLKEHFADIMDENGCFFMDDAEIKLKKIIDHYNLKSI